MLFLRGQNIQYMDRLNVLYIITHDQGIAASIFTGAGPDAYASLPTPNLNTIASQGTILRQHYGTCPLCSPARGSLMTSHYPHVNGLNGLTHRNFALFDNEKTVVQQFKEAGYKTTLIGLQHETEGDIHQLGYDIVIGAKPVKACLKMETDVDNTFHELSTHQGPWWLTIGTKEVHLPWRFQGHPTDPKNVTVPAYLPDLPEIRKHQSELEGVLIAYDTFIGKVMNSLDKYDLREKTLIVITTDHGIAHPRAKGTLYDPGIHTLMIWSNRNLISKGKQLDTLLSSIDFAPTICELCNVSPYKGFSGKSYANLLKSKENTKKNSQEIELNEYIFAEKDFHDIYDPIRCIRSKTHKLIINYEPQISTVDAVPVDIQNAPTYRSWIKTYPNVDRAHEEFYDLVNDPLETDNIALRDPHNPELVKMRERLLAFLKDTNDEILTGKIIPRFPAKIDNALQFPHLLAAGCSPSPLKKGVWILNKIRSIFSNKKKI